MLIGPKPPLAKQKHILCENLIIFAFKCVVEEA